MPSFASNDVTRVFHNRKLDFPSNFFTSNLVVVVVLLAIALISIVLINADTTREKYQVEGSIAEA